MYECLRCGWTGEERELVYPEYRKYAYIAHCPDCLACDKYIQELRGIEDIIDDTRKMNDTERKGYI